MRTMLRTAIAASVLMSATGAFAVPRTATLEVQNVSCAACAPIVKRTLGRLPGVTQVAVIEHGGVATATVTFDDDKVTAQALSEATSNAGYPSSVREVRSAAADTTGSTAQVR
ncbi:cation transporter [Methylobacterium sp.]|uniref:cation transporter n=1 Tax=Methylobacterium sp. TaxID=409 RepID=UPI000C669A5D|nr:cation transporter [Methylobacterium sp.]MBP32670.1 mercury transporter [Methylobacterium sp.]